MAFKHGNRTTVWMDALDVSAYFNDLAFTTMVDTGETTVFTNTWKTFIEGNADAKIDLKGFYDPVNDATFGSLLRNGGGSILTYAPAGALAIGDLVRLVPISETAMSESSPVGGVVLFNASLISNGKNMTDGAAFGYALHTSSVDSGTTTGASKNDAAATTGGWVAHLHVTAVSSGSWVVKLQDSADNSAWADVTGASFTAATTATSQRLVSAAGATLRQYVRYVATVTGGSTPTITFGLAVART